MFKQNNHKLRLLLILILIFTLIIPCSGCTFFRQSTTRTNVPDESLPLVYTSIYPLYDFTKKIGGNKIKVINITPAGAEPHSFEPSTKLLAEISKSALFLYNGAGMEPYLENLRDTLQGGQLLMIEASQGVDLNKENGETDPHIWLNPRYALSMGHNILQALKQIDPDNKDYYEHNFDTFKENLTALDQEYQNTLALCRKRKIIVTHQAFNYLCKAYNLEQIPIMGLNAEAEPSPQKLKEISQLIQKEKINYIFAESLFSPKVAATIAEETGATILPLHPLESLSEKELQAGEDYFSIMRQNLKNLKQALEYTP